MEACIESRLHALLHPDVMVSIMALKRRKQELSSTRPLRASVPSVPRRIPGPTPVSKSASTSGSESFGPEIPLSYKETYLHAIARDPRNIFAFWEIGPRASAEVQKTVRYKKGGMQPALRLYNVDSKGGSRVADFLLGAEESERYVAVQPSDSNRYRFEFGFLMRSGKFMKICASNEVETPRFPAVKQADSAETIAPSSLVNDYLQQKISLPDFTEAYADPCFTTGAWCSGSLDFIPKSINVTE